jgi:phospholipase C
LNNETSASIRGKLTANAYGEQPVKTFAVAAGKSHPLTLDLRRSHHWYDFTVATDEGFQHRFAGRMETGKDSVSDPAMATEL